MRNEEETGTGPVFEVGFHAVQDKRVNLAYNALGQFTFISRYENVGATGTTLRSVYSYDQANRLSGLVHRNLPTSGGLTDLVTYAWQYDPMNRITSQTHTGIDAPRTDGLSTFSYDQTSQLTLADHAPSRPDENLGYDLNGNRNTAGHTTSANNLTTASQDSAGLKYTYLYDKDGNRIQRICLASNGTMVLGVEDFQWDHRNRLSKVTFRATVGGAVTQTVDYSYDIFNRLVKRSHDSNGPAANGVLDTYFAGYDGINPTLELSKNDPGAGGVSASDLKHRYLWGPVVDQLFANEQLTNVTSVGNTLWPLGDQLGTLRDIADFNPGTTNFSITNHRVFDSFGKLTSQTASTVTLAFAYTGKFFDEITGLSLHWNRWYDPNLGKLLSEDPIGFLAGDANLGRYVGNQANRVVDRSGLDWLDSYSEWVFGWSGTEDIYRSAGEAGRQVLTGAGVSNDHLANMAANEALVWTAGAATVIVVGGAVVVKVGVVVTGVAVTKEVADFAVEQAVNYATGGAVPGLPLGFSDLVETGIKSTVKQGAKNVDELAGAVAPKGIAHVIPESRLGHIFRDAPGHLRDTVANRRLLQEVAEDVGTTLGTDKYGNIWSARLLPDGTQAWTQVRNREIINGGLNLVPRNFSPLTGLSSPTPP